MGAGYQAESIDVVELGMRGAEKRKKRLLTSPVTLDPNNQPAPRGLTAHVSTSSGSDHIRSGVRWKTDHTNRKTALHAAPLVPLILCALGRGCGYQVTNLRGRRGWTSR